MNIEILLIIYMTLFIELKQIHKKEIDLDSLSNLLLLKKKAYILRRKI